MVETKQSLSSILPFYETMPTRLGTAIVLAYFDHKYRGMTLMKRLNRSTAKYLQANEHHLDQFWSPGLPVKFSADFIGNSKFEETGGVVGIE